MLLSLSNRRNCLQLYSCWFGDKRVWYSVLVLLCQKVVKILKVPNKIEDNEAEGNMLFMRFHQVIRIRYEAIYPSVLGSAVVFMN